MVFGVFSGMCYPGLINGALHQVTSQDSRVQTAMQQFGSALGLATLATLALHYAGGRIRDGVLPAVALSRG